MWFYKTVIYKNIRHIFMYRKKNFTTRIRYIKKIYRQHLQTNLFGRYRNSCFDITITKKRCHD